jgi:hypothetical protein
MSTPTTELGLQRAVDADDTADYLVTNLANSLTTVDSLFNNVSGHTHSGAHQGGPIATLGPGSVTNANLGPDVARDNLLTNGGFEIWQRGNGPFTASGTYTADRWGMAMTGTDALSVSRNTANADTANGSVACAACVYTAGTGANSQLQATLKVSDGYQLTGRTYSLSVRCSASVANAARITVSGDGGFTTVNSAFHPGGSTYQTLTVTFTCTATQTQVVIGLQHVVSCTAYWDNAMLVVGSQPANYVPLHPADDLARCLRYYEIWGVGAAGKYLMMGQCYTSTSAICSISYRAEKAVTPTVTAAALSNFVMLNATGGSITPTGISPQSTSTRSNDFNVSSAGGVVAGNASLIQNSSGSGIITIEANP